MEEGGRGRGGREGVGGGERGGTGIGGREGAGEGRERRGGGGLKKVDTTPPNQSLMEKDFDNWYITYKFYCSQTKNHVVKSTGVQTKLPILLSVLPQPTQLLDKCLVNPVPLEDSVPPMDCQLIFPA